MRSGQVGLVLGFLDIRGVLDADIGSSEFIHPDMGRAGYGKPAVIPFRLDVLDERVVPDLLGNPGLHVALCPGFLEGLFKRS